MKLFKNRLIKEQLNKLMSLNIIVAGNTSYTRHDGINVIALGHLFVR
ncbi:MAG: hypothetical protein LBG49_02555 [Mycoplasmataceae bacterium]|nr:hypothetical protein [Mycoplasmataceae bacterium]